MCLSGEFLRPKGLSTPKWIATSLLSACKATGDQGGKTWNGCKEKPWASSPALFNALLNGFHFTSFILFSIALKTSKPSNHQWLFQSPMCYSLALIKCFCHGAFEVLWTHGNKCARLMWSCLSLKSQYLCPQWSGFAHLHVDFRSHVPLSYPLDIALPAQADLTVCTSAGYSCQSPFLVQ